MALVVVVVAVWLGLIINPNTGPLVLGAMGALGIGVGAILTAMPPGAAGIGLVSVVTRTVGWLRRGAHWPDDPGVRAV